MLCPGQFILVESVCDEEVIKSILYVDQEHCKIDEIQKVLEPVWNFSKNMQRNICREFYQLCYGGLPS